MCPFEFRARARYIQVRTFNLRDTRAMRDLNPSDIDKMVAIRGMVTRCTSIIPDLKMAYFKCLVCGEAPELTFVDRGGGGGGGGGGFRHQSHSPVHSLSTFRGAFT